MDAFSAQIVKFVREMPDEALLDLVKQKLGVLGVSKGRGGLSGLDGRGKATRHLPLPTPVATKRERGKPPSQVQKKRGRAPARRGIPAVAERQSMLDTVERVVKAGSGVSASDVARSAGIPQTRAAAALKELKLTQRIFQGGDRRFARYAGDAKTAEQASATARKNAKGPTLPSPKKVGHAKKRAAGGKKEE
jgi:hypothetical protein